MALIEIDFLIFCFLGSLSQKGSRPLCNWWVEEHTSQVQYILVGSGARFTGAVHTGG